MESIDRGLLSPELGSLKIILFSLEFMRQRSKLSVKDYTFNFLKISQVSFIQHIFINGFLYSRYGHKRGESEVKLELPKIK